MAYIKGINIVIGADTTQLDVALGKIDSNTKSLNNELRDINRALKFDPKNTDLLAQKTKILNERFNDTKSRLDALRLAQDDVTAAYKRGDITEEQYRQFQTDIDITKSKLNGYEKQLKDVNKELLTHGTSIGVASEKLKDFGNKATDASKKLAPASIAATGALIAMGNEAIKFESAFAGVDKTFPGTVEQLNAVRQGIRDMAKEIPSSTTEISKVAEAAGQLGIKAESILDFTKVMIDLGNSTNLSAEEGATALAKFANITRMSQNDFSNLGSAVVSLGNNFATTEADIVAMALNLGSAGTQVGMTQSDIVALAASLSSVGLEAQAGGTAFSKIMVEMQLATETGSESLQDFARVAGMTSEEFIVAFKEDATGAILAFIDGLSKTGEQGESAIKVLDDMEIRETRLRDALLRSANASDIMTEAVDLSSEAWSNNSALTDEANKRYETRESQIQIMINKIKDLAIELGDKLLPHVDKFVDFVGDLADGFGELDPGMQDFIIKAIAMTAVASPAVGLVGNLSKGLGGLLGGAKLAGSALGLLKPAGAVASTALASTGAAATSASGGIVAAAGGIGGATASLGGFVAAAAPWAIGIGVAGVAAYGVYKTLEEDVIPAVDLFADGVKVSTEEVIDANGNMTTQVKAETVKISEDAQERIGIYMEMSSNVQTTLNDMYLGLTESTTENVENLKTQNLGLADSIIENVNRQRDNSVSAYQEMFDNATSVSSQQETDVLETLQKGYDERVVRTELLQQELEDIYDQIKESGVGITKSQQQRINELNDLMKKQAVRSMADTEAEQNVILNRLSSSNTRVTAQMVGDAIKEYNRLYDESVATAQAQRDETVKQAELMREELGPEYSKLADQIIEDANRTYENTVAATSKTRTEGLDKLKDSYGDLYNKININTGNIKNMLSEVGNLWDNTVFEDKRIVVATEYRSVYSSVNLRPGESAQKYMAYNNGLEYVPYNDFLATLHKGERVLTADENRQLNQQGFLDSMRSKLGELSNTVLSNVDNSTVNNNFVMAGTYVIREEADIKKVARELAHQSRQLARSGG